MYLLLHVVVRPRRTISSGLSGSTSKVWETKCPSRLHRIMAC